MTAYRTVKRKNRNQISPTMLIMVLLGILVLILLIGFLLVHLLHPKHHPIAMDSVRNVLPASACIDRSGTYYTYDDPSTGISSRIGIDVSSHQKDINWEKVKKNHIDFAYIRLGLRGYESGNIVEDEYFEKNIKEAYDADLSVGVYFFSQALTEDEAKEEAEFVIEKLKKHPIDLHVVYDFERVENETSRSATGNTVDVTKNALTFCRLMEEAGYKPMIYTNAYLAKNDYDFSQLSDIDVWYANYNDTPSELGRSFAVWQYTENGTLSDGSVSPLDMNLLFVDASSKE